MVQIIQRVLAAAVLIAIAILSASTALAQSQRQLSWCTSKDDALSPALRIEGCTATIRSGRQSGENLSWAFYNRGIAYTKKAQYDRAIADFDEALKLDPDSAVALNNRGTAYARKGEFDRAIADFNEAIRLDADSATAYNNRGTAYAKKGQYDYAIEDFDQAIRLNPNDVSALNNRRLAKQLKGTVVAAAPNAAPVNPARVEQPKVIPPAVEINDESKSRSQIEQQPVNPPAVDVKNAGAPDKRRPAKQIKAASAAGTKVASAPKSRGAVAFKQKSRVHHAAARPHRAKSQSVLARLFRKPLIDFRKVFRVASQRRTY